MERLVDVSEWCLGVLYTHCTPWGERNVYMLLYIKTHQSNNCADLFKHILKRGTKHQQMPIVVLYLITSFLSHIRGK